MSVSILVDMNLSEEWIPLLQQAGWRGVQWSITLYMSVILRDVSMDCGCANGFSRSKKLVTQE